MGPAPNSVGKNNFYVSFIDDFYLKNFRFMAQVDPSKLTKIINEIDIKLFLPTEVGASAYTSNKTN